MSTRSTLTLKQEVNGIICYKTIYCHFDGYPEHHFPILMKHYDTIEKVEELINLGSLSILDESSDCPEDHSFDNAIKGYCVAYHRDRGEDWKNCYPRVKPTFEECQKEEYNYLFEDGYGWSLGDNRDWDIIMTSEQNTSLRKKYDKWVYNSWSKNFYVKETEI